MSNDKTTKQIAVSLIGGIHHYLHIVPVAVALSHRQEMDVVFYVPHSPDRVELKKLLRNLNAGPVTITTSKALPFPWLPDKLLSKWNHAKIPKLLFWAKAMRRADAILAAERTSTILKTLPGQCPPMFHIPHGVGDRKKGFEKRIRRFDHILVGGEKDRLRMISENVATPDNCHVTGGIKLSTLQRQYHGNRIRLFGNDRPVILYNAHFDDSLASWNSSARKIITDISNSDRFNLIVAPHIRRFSDQPSNEKAHWKSLAIPDKVIVDLDTARLQDFSYTMAADIYLGDVSSQVYEFISLPRPCVFINAHKISWQGNNDYLMWQMGRVVDTSDGILPAIENAQGDHAEYLDKQIKYGLAAFGDIKEDAAQKAAEIITGLIQQN